MLLLTDRFSFYSNYKNNAYSLEKQNRKEYGIKEKSRASHSPESGLLTIAAASTPPSTVFSCIHLAFGVVKFYVF